MKTRATLRCATVLFFLAGSSALAQTRFGLWPVQGNGPLELVRHDVQVRIEHPLAETMVTQEFENPTGRSLEAYYYYPVPAGATVSGLALWVKGVRREARMLERQRAREIYQGIVDQKRDPALVERLSGNLFRIRIFPVLPHRRQRVELRFVQPVGESGPGRYAYRLDPPPGPTVNVLRLGAELRAPGRLRQVQLAGLPAQLRPDDAGGYRLPLGAARHRFRAPLEIRYRLARRAPLALTQQTTGQRLFVAELPRSADAAPDPRRVLILVDRSRSMRPHEKLANEAIRRLLAALRPADQVAVVPFDLLPLASTELAPADHAGRSRARAALRLPSRGLGSAFLPVLRHVLERDRATSIVLITDGGDRYHQSELEEICRLLFDRREIALSVLGLGALTNEALLQRLAELSGGVQRRLRQDTDLDTVTGAVGAVLSRSTPLSVRTAEGTPLLQLRRDPHRVLLAGQLPSSGPEGTITLEVDGEAMKLPLTPATSTRAVAGLWALARIDRLMERIQIFGEEPELVANVVELSKRHRVISEYTALLATETDADYQRQTSGQTWQRQVVRAADVAEDMPAGGFHSTPEPHEWALIGLALLLLYFARRWRWLATPARWRV